VNFLYICFHLESKATEHFWKIKKIKKERKFKKAKRLDLNLLSKLPFKTQFSF
jgi:hypothetical protein